MSAQEARRALMALRLEAPAEVMDDVDRIILPELAAVDRVRALFVGGPDTPCRTTWPDGVECVEVPLADLRAALDGQAEGDKPDQLAQYADERAAIDAAVKGGGEIVIKQRQATGD